MAPVDPASRAWHPSRLAVQPTGEALCAAARELAADLGVPVRRTLVAPATAGGSADPSSSPGPGTSPTRRALLEAARDDGLDLLLVLTPRRLELQSTAEPISGPIWADLTGDDAGGPRRRLSARDPDPLVRATGLHRMSAAERRAWRCVDATTGLGRDTHHIISLGCQVVSMERSPVIAALLRDAYARAEAADETGTFSQRLTLVAPVDARDGLLRRAGADDAPHLVLVDPMHPPRRKSARVRKELRLVRAAVGDDPDAKHLLEAALACAQRRVVVKRPAGSPPLAGLVPSRAVEGRSVRYDVYLR